MNDMQIKAPKVAELVRKCELQMERYPAKTTIKVKVPRYSVPEDDETCNLLGVTGTFLNKTTCCMEIEFPVADLHRALSNVNL